MLFFAALIMLLFGACQKNDVKDPAIGQNNGLSVTAKKVNEWLDKQLTTLAKPGSKEKVKEMREHLLLTELSYEERF
jgi:hypothetical protein